MMFRLITLRQYSVVTRAVVVSGPGGLVGDLLSLLSKV
jgi:hypothetical protein